MTKLALQLEQAVRKRAPVQNAHKRGPAQEGLTPPELTIQTSTKGEDSFTCPYGLLFAWLLIYGPQACIHRCPGLAKR